MYSDIFWQFYSIFTVLGINSIVHRRIKTNPLNIFLGKESINNDYTFPFKRAPLPKLSL